MLSFHSAPCRAVSSPCVGSAFGEGLGPWGKFVRNVLLVVGDNIAQARTFLPASQVGQQQGTLIGVR